MSNYMNCPFEQCNERFSYRNLLFQHVRSHADLGCSTMVCSECSNQSKSYNAFYHHVCRNHAEWGQPILNQPQIECPLPTCSVITNCSSEVRAHFYNVHPEDIQSKSLVCKFCDNQEINSLDAFFRHLYRHHASSLFPCPLHSLKSCRMYVTSSTESAEMVWEQSAPPSLVGSPPCTNEDSFLMEFCVDPGQIENQSSNIISQQKGATAEELLSSLTLLYLKAYTLRLIPKSTTMEIFEDLSWVFSKLHARLISFIPDGVASSLCQSAPYLLDPELFPDMVKRIDKVYDAKSEEMGFFPPEKITLDEAGSSFFHYIPVLKTLRALLSKPQYFNHIEEFRQNTFNGGHCDLHYSEYFYSNSYFKGNRNLLNIHLYADEVTTTNPLGQAKGKFKILCIYFTLDNIHPRFNTLLKNIHPVAFANSKVVKKYGINSILKPFVHEMKYLSIHGLSFNLILEDGSSERLTFKGSLSVVSGDNLSQHEIGGFSCCFSSGHICRFCDALYENQRVYLKESDCTLLINNVHYRNMLDSSTCILEEIPGFSRLTGLIPDIQHDFLIGTGGVVNSCMRIVFLYLIIERRMTVQELNERILHFSYGNSDKRDKPYATMTEYDTCTFSFKSAQSLCLFYLIPFIFHDKICPTHFVWKLFYTMTDIVGIAFAAVVKDGWGTELTCLVENYFKLLADHRGRLTDHVIKPKLHFLLHYGRLINYFGTFRPFWCSRFESFHTIVKNVVRANKNFKNLTYSISNRIQNLKCYQRNVSGLGAELVCGSSSKVNLCDLNEDLVLFLNRSIPSLQTMGIYRTYKLDIDGHGYKKDNVYLISISSAGKPCLCVLDFVLLIKKLIVCCAKKLIVNGYNKQLTAFTVSKTYEDCYWIHPTKMYHPSLSIYKLLDQYYVKLKYRVPGVQSI